jgi:hypothetical protein
MPHGIHHRLAAEGTPQVGQRGVEYDKGSAHPLPADWVPFGNFEAAKVCCVTLIASCKGVNLLNVLGTTGID